MIPIVLPETSPCDEPPPNCGLATHEPARNVVTASNSRWVRTSIVIMTYSAIRRLVAEDVADRDSFRDRRGVQEVKTSRHGLKQAKARRGREPRDRKSVV